MSMMRGFLCGKVSRFHRDIISSLIGFILLGPLFCHNARPVAIVCPMTWRRSPRSLARRHGRNMCLGTNVALNRQADRFCR